MASQCKRQQCTIDRRGFRQELDSWRHKLIHCVGFESILEGLFGPELVEDLKLFKDLEPVAASDWSFDENCQFCCLRRDKVKEHLIGLNKEELQDALRPHLAKDHAAISKLEKQAEEFLNAVLSRKDVPSFSDPHIPVVAREILQRMIRQFAAEYTSKTSPPQDSCSDNQPSSDQSLPDPQQPPSSPAAVVAGPAHSQNPVLSKLLMADQDAPLDLTIKKPQSEPSEQDGVLDLSIKKNRNSSSAPVRSPCLFPLTSALKGESQDMRLAKAKELQSTPSLEQFIAKLCAHHQRQIVTTLGYLQTELKALSSTPPSTQKAISFTTKPSMTTPVKLLDDVKALCTSTPKVELQDVSVTLPSVKKRAQVSLNISAVAAELPSPGCKKSLPAVSPVETASVRSDHVPLKMKIMKTSNVATGKKLSCVLTTSISSDLENSEDRPELAKGVHSARLSSSSKKQNQSSHLIKMTKTYGHCKDVPASPFTVHAGVPADLPRTARKSIRAAMDQNAKQCAQRIIVDPDIGQCDIVYINKPITECFKEPQRHMTPRRNARKSTRGHLYSDDIWVVKTVRTLAGRGNCPNPMPDLITLVTPKQMMSKPESVPPVDTPFVGACVETVVDSGSADNPFERAIAGSEDVVEVAVNEADVGVETSQTDQQLTTQDAGPQPLMSCDTKDDHDKASAREREENVAPVDSEVNSRTGRKEGGSIDPTAPKQLEDCGDAVKTQLSSGDVPADNSGSDVEQLSQETASEMIQEVKQGTQEENQPQEYQPPITCQNVLVPQKASEPSPNVLAIPTPDRVSPVRVVEVVVEDVKDVSSKTLDEELPPSLRKSGSVSVAPEQVEVIVGYVNGKPVSASDRSLRHKLTSGPLTTKTEKSNSKKTPTVKAVAAAVEGNPSHTVPALPQTPVQVLDKPSCLKSKPLMNDKDIKREKRKLNDSASLSEQPESKRQLRSASQKATVALPSTSKLQTSTKKPSLPSPPSIPNSDLSTPPLEAVPSPQRGDDQASSSSVTPDIGKESTKTVSVANPSDCDLSSAPTATSPGKPSDGLDSSPLPSASPQTRDDGTMTPSHQPSASPEEPDETQESSPQPLLICSPTPEAPKVPLASSSKTSSLQPSNEKDKSPTNPEETFKSKRLQAKQRLRSAKASEHSDPGTKPSSALPPAIPPPTSGAETLCPASASSKSSGKDTQRDKEQRFEAKQKLRSAKVGEHSTETETSPPQPPPTAKAEASQSSPGCSSQQCLDQSGIEKAQLGPVHSSDTHIDKSESSLPKLRSARLREDVENLKATGEKSTVAKHETESVAIKCSDKNETEAKDLAQTPSEASAVEPPASVADKPTRMPLRSESSKAERSLQSASDSQKPNLRSQRHPPSDTSDASSTVKRLDFGSPNRMIPKKTPRAPPRSPTPPVSPARPQLSAQTVSRSRSEPCKKADKFFELLNQEENKQLLTNLNIRFDKMQKGWVQLDKESQPGTKNKHKADRQAVIWKSKRRIRKPKLPEHQKYSPVQMLFMRGFDLSSICRWFLESTETKSLVIVKKVNTRLPSETQLCFHGGAGSSGGSLGVFPSLQAERLKKHLKKFAIASPVKSNPRSQKLIAKVLGLEASAVKGKEKRDPPSSSQTLTKSRMSAEIPKQKSESQKASKSKNPTSARILRKYSNIRGKMQVQHTGARLKDTSSLKAKSVKAVAASKTASKSNPKPTVKSPKSPASKQAKDSAENSEANKSAVGKTSAKVLEKAAKVQKTNKAPAKNTRAEFPKRCSRRIGSPKLLARNKPEKKEAEKREARKSPPDRPNAAKVQTKQTPPNPDAKKNNVVVAPAEQSSDATATGDQVLTRSQKKMEAAAPQTAAQASKKTGSTLTRAAKSENGSQKLAARPPMTRSGALTKLAKARPVTAGPSAAKKAKKRALEILSTPAKRTRISLSK